MNKTFELREEIEFEIQNMKPSWWMRYGILVVFIILAIIISLGAIIRYPDTIYGDFRFMSSQPSITIPLSQNVQVDRLFRTEGDTLKKGEHILVFRNSADYQDICEVSDVLSNSFFTDEEFNSLYEKVKSRNFRLGEIQSIWTQLHAKLFEHYAITKLGKYEGKLTRLERQLTQQRELGKQLSSQILMSERQDKIIAEFSEMDSILFAKRVMSKAEYLQKRGEYIGKNKEQKQYEIASKQNELEVVALANSIEATKDEYTEKLLSLHMEITETISKILSDIAAWKKSYLVEAPINGRLNILGNIDEKGFVVSDDYKIVITPRRLGFKAIVKIPLLSAGKVQLGQTVHFKLNDYPYKEYGYLEAKINEIANVAGKDYYQMEVNLRETLKTNYKKPIYIKENMSGIAEIITEDRNILSRVLDKFLYIFRHN